MGDNSTISSNDRRQTFEKRTRLRLSTDRNGLDRNVNALTASSTSSSPPPVAPLDTPILFFAGPGNDNDFFGGLQQQRQRSLTLPSGFDVDALNYFDRLTFSAPPSITQSTRDASGPVIGTLNAILSPVNVTTRKLPATAADAINRNAFEGDQPATRSETAGILDYASDDIPQGDVHPLGNKLSSDPGTTTLSNINGGTKRLPSRLQQSMRNVVTDTAFTSMRQLTDAGRSVSSTADCGNRATSNANTISSVISDSNGVPPRSSTTRSYTYSAYGEEGRRFERHGNSTRTLLSRRTLTPHNLSIRVPSNESSRLNLTVRLMKID